MLVCHCHAVNETRIRECIAGGARDEVDVAAECGAGSQCGGCVPTICRLLGECAGYARDGGTVGRVLESR